jgi:hypothetical protein
MGFFENNEVRLTFTDYGKEKFFNDGYKDTFTYFSLSDDNVIYHLDVEPSYIFDINGYHNESTFKIGSKFKIPK